MNVGTSVNQEEDEEGSERCWVSEATGRTDADREGSMETLPAQEVLRSVKSKAHQKANRISVLKTANEGLTLQVKESRMLLVRAHQELQVKNEQIQKLADENANLLSSAKSEKGIFPRQAFPDVDHE
jgi:hypothetical protein